LKYGIIDKEPPDLENIETNIVKVPQIFPIQPEKSQKPATMEPIVHDTSHEDDDKDDKDAVDDSSIRLSSSIPSPNTNETGDWFTSTYAPVLTPDDPEKFTDNIGSSLGEVLGKINDEGLSVVSDPGEAMSVAVGQFVDDANSVMSSPEVRSIQGKLNEFAVGTCDTIKQFINSPDVQKGIGYAKDSIQNYVSGNAPVSSSDQVLKELESIEIVPNTAATNDEKKYNFVMCNSVEIDDADFDIPQQENIVIPECSPSKVTKVYSNPTRNITLEKEGVAHSNRTTNATSAVTGDGDSKEAESIIASSNEAKINNGNISVSNGSSLEQNMQEKLDQFVTDAWINADTIINNPEVKKVIDSLNNQFVAGTKIASDSINNLIERSEKTDDNTDGLVAIPNFGKSKITNSTNLEKTAISDNDSLSKTDAPGLVSAAFNSMLEQVNEITQNNSTSSVHEAFSSLLFPSDTATTPDKSDKHIKTDLSSDSVINSSLCCIEDLDTTASLCLTKDNNSCSPPSPASVATNIDNCNQSDSVTKEQERNEQKLNTNLRCELPFE